MMCGTYLKDYSVVPSRKREVVLEQIILCHDLTTCYCHRTACSESLRWFIHLSLFTDKTPHLGLEPYGASNAREVGGILHPAGQLLGRHSRGIWPAWISSAGWNRGRYRQGVKDRVHRSLLSTWTPESPETELLRILVSLEHTLMHNTHL